MKSSVLFAAVVATAISVRADTIRFSPGCFVKHEESGLSLSILSLSMTWDVPGPMMASLSGSPFPDAETGVRSFHMGAARNGIDPDAAGTLRAKIDPQNPARLFLDYTLTPPKDQDIFDVFLGGTVDAADYAGGAFTVDGRKIGLPGACRQGHAGLFHGRVSKVAFYDAQGALRFSIDYPEPREIDVKDSRCWGSTRFILYQYLRRGGKVTAGEKLTHSLVLNGRSAFRDDSALRVVKAGRDWIPMTFDRDILEGSACDFSKQTGIEAPAGKYGFVVARGENFEFEGQPGVPVRFYGNNICHAIPQVSREKARKLAAELKKNGYNAIRLHYWDIRMTSGVADGTTIPPERLAAFDGFMKEMIDAGIYVATDLYTSRQVPFRSVGIDRPGIIPMDMYKDLLLVHPGVRRNLEEYVRQLLTHVNLLTGRDYAHEPALAWYCIVNEGNAGNFGKRHMDEFPCYAEAWKRHCAKLGIRDAGDIPVNFRGDGKEAARVRGFLRALETDLDRHFKAFVRSLGSRALVSSMNAWFNPVSYQLIREDVYDYVDDHFYVDHPVFIGKGHRGFPTQCEGVNPVRDHRLGVPGVVSRRLMNKPFTVTEYNHSVPGMYRGGGGLMIAAFAARQNWSGVWRFCFGKEAERIDDPNPFRMTFHDTWSDPMMRAAEYPFAALFLRRDLEPFAERTVVACDRTRLEAAERGEATEPKDAFKPQNWPEASACWRARVGTLVVEKARTNETIQVAGAVDRAVRMDAKAATFTVDTPRTSGVFGEKGVVETSFVKADLGPVPAAVWAVSVDGDPLRQAPRILLGHLTDCEDEGTEFFGSGVQYLKKWGKPPHLIRNAKARIVLDVPAAVCEVWALTSGGRRRTRLATTAENGKLCFEANVARDPASATWLYEVSRTVR